MKKKEEISILSFPLSFEKDKQFSAFNNT